MFVTSLGLFLFGLVAAMAGGFLGAAIGGNFAFALTGFSVIFGWGILIGSGSTAGLDYVAFGPFMGPHVTFAAGVAAAAYAAKKGYVDSGRDVTSPLAGLGKPDVLYVGAVFGVIGYLIQVGLSQVPWFGGQIDSVALAVMLSGIISRLVYGGGSLMNREKWNNSSSFLGKIAPNATDHWLRYQEKPKQYLSIGLFFGLAAAGVSIALAQYFPESAGVAHTFVFGISAIIILFLILGADMPVQHHVTIIAGLAAVRFMPILGGSDFAWGGEWDSGMWLTAIGALLIGALFGAFAAWLAEVSSQLFHQRGTTHWDPPAASIWLSTFIVLTLVSLIS